MQIQFRPDLVDEVVGGKVALEAVIEFGLMFAIFGAVEFEARITTSRFTFDQHVNELLFFRLFGAANFLLLLAFGVGIPAFLPDPGTTGAVGIAAQLGQLLVDLAEEFPFLFGVGFLLQQQHGQAAHFDGEDGGKVVDQLALPAGVVEVEVFGGVEQLGSGFASFLAPEPILVAGLFPVGKVLFGDRAVVELVGEDFLDVGLVVEPLDDFDAGLVVFDAETELVANGFGEAGYF